MDTDSFIIEVIGENVDDIMLENKEYFHLSNFPKDSKYYCIDNKKVPGKMKDEFGGTPIIEFISPKPKSYTLIDDTYKIDDPLLIKHFLLETVEEINNDLIKNNKPYRVSFGYNILNHFLNEDDAYYKKNRFYNDDRSLNNYKLLERIEILNKIVRSCSFSNKFFLTIKDMETDLPVLYL